MKIRAGPASTLLGGELGSLGDPPAELSAEEEAALPEEFQQWNTDEDEEDDL